MLKKGNNIAIIHHAWYSAIAYYLTVCSFSRYRKYSTLQNSAEVSLQVLVVEGVFKTKTTVVVNGKSNLFDVTMNSDMMFSNDSLLRSFEGWMVCTDRIICT